MDTPDRPARLAPAPTPRAGWKARGAAMADEIQRLPIGVAIVVGGGVQMPLLVEVRPRETRHGGESVKVIED